MDYDDLIIRFGNFWGKKGGKFCYLDHILCIKNQDKRIFNGQELMQVLLTE